MRRPRLKASEGNYMAYYHWISRVVNRDFVLRDQEKEQFVVFMWTNGLRIISYSITSNQFHILVEIPQRPLAEVSPFQAC